MWIQKEGETKETMDRHDQRELHRTASDTSGFHMQDIGQESVESNHRLTDTCNGIAWAIKEKKDNIFSSSTSLYSFKKSLSFRKNFLYFRTCCKVKYNTYGAGSGPRVVHPCVSFPI